MLAKQKVKPTAEGKLLTDIVNGTATEVVVPEAATKHDAGKPDLSLVPLAYTEAAARALGFGTIKYERNNFRKGGDVTRLVAALLRHVGAWNEGMEYDKESNLSHLDHAAACLAMLLANLKEGKAIDNRYKA